MKPGRIELPSLKRAAIGRVGPKVGRIGSKGEEEEDLKKDLDDTTEDLGQLLSAASQQKRIEEANDSEYWVALYFLSREQKEAFLAALKLDVHGDKYIDGVEAARTMGIPLPAGPKMLKMRRFSKFADTAAED